MNRVVPVHGARLSLWRAAVVFRVAALVVCLYLILRWRQLYQHPGQAFAVGSAMVLVTGLIGYLGWTGRAHRLPVVAGDLLASVLLTLTTRSVQTLGQRHGSMPTLTTIWATGPVVEAAIVTGLVGGLVAALVQIAAAMAVRDGWDGRTLDSAVLLLVAGSVVGYLGRLIVQAEEQTGRWWRSRRPRPSGSGWPDRCMTVRCRCWPWCIGTAWRPVAVGQRSVRRRPSRRPRCAG